MEQGVEGKGRTVVKIASVSAPRNLSVGAGYTMNTIRF